MILSLLRPELFPLAIARGEGCRLWDADGHEYIDFIAEFTAGLYGHSNPLIRQAIDRALDAGINLSGHNLLESELARLICDRFPAVDAVRFTNSGRDRPTAISLREVSRALRGRPRLKAMAVVVQAIHSGEVN